MPKQNKKDHLAEIAQDPSIFSMEGQMEFAEDANGKTDGQNVRLKLYDGGINQHWYYGAVAFDLATMKLEKAKIPILLDHSTSQRLGFSTGAEFDPAFILEGRLLKEDDLAQKIRSQAKEGFPFESSLRFDFDRADQLEVKAGSTAKVNGRTLKGPGVVIYNAIIKEGSVCTFGALKNCRSQVFNQPETKEHPMPLTLDTFKQENDGLFNEIHTAAFTEGQTQGEANERAIFAELAAACGDDHALLVDCYSNGKTVQDALTLKADKMAAENAQLRLDLAEAKKAPGPKTVDRAKTEFSDTEDHQEEAAAGDTTTFMDKAKAYAAEHKCSLADAVDKCVSLYPDHHAKMTGENDA